MSIPFFSPIYPSNDPTVRENCSFLRFTTHFFDWGEPDSYRYIPYKITRYTDDISGFEIIPGKKGSIDKGALAIKFALICTLVIPIFILLGLVIYRTFNSFQLSPNRLSKEKLPEELFNKIIAQTGVFALPLAATNKENRERVQNDPWYQKSGNILNESIKTANAIETGKTKYDAKQFIKGIVHPSVNMFGGFLYRQIKDMDISDALNTIKSSQWGTRSFDRLAALSRLALESAKRNLKDAEAILFFAKDPSGFNIYNRLKRTIEKHKSGEKTDHLEYKLLCIARIIALNDIPKALEIADHLQNDGIRDDILLCAIEVAANSNTDRALDIANRIKNELKKEQAFFPIIKALAKSDPEKALTIINSPTRIDKVPLLNSFFTTLAECDPEKAEKMAKALDDLEKGNARVAIVKVLRISSMERALKIANRIRNIHLQGQALKYIVEILALTDLERALALIETIQSQPHLHAAKIAVAKAVAATDKDRALIVANSIEDSKYKSKALASIAFK